jgi:DNA invertase Pin-like site-specific DNA recombinase
MDAQKAAVETFLSHGDRELVAQFSEVETGKRNDRPQLQEALALCRNLKAVLLIAKLDRLSRCASFLLNLRDGGVPFTCCDMPEADRFTVGIIALVAERERELISQRTKAAMTAAKRRGMQLGNPRLAQARQNAVNETKKRAGNYLAKLAPVLQQIQRQGRVTEVGEMAECLNARGFKTATGKAFTLRTVRRLLRQARSLELNGVVRQTGQG